jgi:hypothetical protein
VDIYLYETTFADVPGLEGERFVLELGKDDFPYIKGFEPASDRPAPCRTITDRSGIRLPFSSQESPSGIQVHFRFQHEQESCAGIELVVEYILGDQRTRRRYPIDECGPPLEITDWIEALTNAKLDMIELAFLPRASRPRAETQKPIPVAIR